MNTLYVGTHKKTLEELYKLIDLGFNYITEKGYATVDSESSDDVIIMNEINKLEVE